MEPENPIWTQAQIDEITGLIDSINAYNTEPPEIIFMGEICNGLISRRASEAARISSRPNSVNVEPTVSFEEMFYAE